MKLNALLIMMIFAIGLISAAPYQLNLSSGILTDLNESNNTTGNITIYVINQNYTINQTQTFNYTYYIANETFNQTYYLTNITNDTYYNTSQADGIFVTITDFNSYKTALVFPYPSKTEFDALVSRVNNITLTTPEETSHGGLWFMILISAIAIGLVFGYIKWKEMQGDEGAAESTYSFP